MTHNTNKTKTHWLQNPNKNYLGHWDLPNGNPLVLTIKSAQWEEVKNPIINVSEAKRVIRFEEAGIKPFICNETNAQSILCVTGHSYMEDSVGMKIKLYLSQVKVMGELVDCLRVKAVGKEDLVVKYISDIERDSILDLLESAQKDVLEFCDIMKIKDISELPANKYEKVCTRLQEIIDGNN